MSKLNGSQVSSEIYKEVSTITFLEGSLGSPYRRNEELSGTSWNNLARITPEEICKMPVEFMR